MSEFGLQQKARGGWMSSLGLFKQSAAYYCKGRQKSIDHFYRRILGLVIRFVVPMVILAYVDPGTGLLMWQAIVAAFVGTFFYVKKTRDWVLRIIFRRKIAGKPADVISGTASGAVQKQNGIVSANETSAPISR